MAVSLLKFSFKTNLVKSLLFEVISKISTYHYTFGKKEIWPTVYSVTNPTQIVSSETNPPEVADTFPYELESRGNIIYTKAIDANDVCAIVERRNWTAGIIYDMYDDYNTDYLADSGAASPDTAEFYVLNDEYNVYKCLYNNQGAASTSRPNGTSREPQSYEDGYVWKYMYTIPLYMRNKFMTSSIMPVVTALTNQFYSNGTIVNYSIQNKGNKLVRTNTYGLTEIIVINGGSGYVGGENDDSDFYFDPPNKLAEITSTISAGAVTTLTITEQGNGYSNQLAYAPKIYIDNPPAGGTRAEATAIITNGKLTGYTLTNPGAGYTSAPAVTVDTPPGGITEGDPAVPQFEAIVDGSGTVERIIIFDKGAGYTENALPTLKVKQSSTGVGLQLKEKYELDTYTIIKINGDGINPANPYSIKSIDVLQGGAFNAKPSGNLITFPQPQISGGTLPSVKLNWSYNSTTQKWFLSSVDVVEEGTGYSSPVYWDDESKPNNATSQFLKVGGCVLDLNIEEQRNDAILRPIINVSGEMDAIKVINEGLGYTYASAIVESKITTYVSGQRTQQALSSTIRAGYSNAIVQLDFGIGDIESKQSDVELSAVDGAINACRVLNSGTGGYNPNTKLTVVGDGTDCELVPVIRNGLIVGVNVKNPGKNYRYANVVIDGQGGTGASIKAIIAPKGGHGKDAIEELYANTIIFTSRLINEKLYNEVTLTAPYRQISIIKNFKKYGVDESYKNVTGSTCFLIRGNINALNTASFNVIDLESDPQIDQYMYLGSEANKYLVVEAAESNGSYLILLQPMNTSSTINPGDSVYILDGGAQKLFSVSSSTYPSINKYSGEMIFLQNKIKFVESAEQAVVLSTLIKF